MASAKRFSVAGTQNSYASCKTYSPSVVYSLTGGDDVGDGSLGAADAYNALSAAGAMEGSTMVNAYGRGVTPEDATPPASSEVTAIDNVTSKPNAIGLPATTATTVICGTRTTKGNGHGLVVKFATTSAAVPANNATASNYTIIHRGNGYKDNDTVEIDGFPDSVLTVNGVQ